MKWSILLLTALPVICQAQNVGIGTATPSESAALEVYSGNRGFLPPRLTRAERNSISGTEAGLMIWCIDCGMKGEMQVYNGSIWTNMTGGISPSVDTLICGKYWMLKSLDVAAYRDGTPIPKVTDPAVWASLTTGAYCYYNNDSATYAALYGKLYNWYAVNDPRGLAPAGFRIPTAAEYTALAACLGPNAGGHMKETGTTHWQAPNTNATNSSGFLGLPSGKRFFGGSFGFSGTDLYLWTSTGPSANAEVRSINNASGILFQGTIEKTSGHSVRCIR